MSTSPTWTTDAEVPARRLGPMDWLRVGLRGGAIVALLASGLAVLLAVRLFERPLHGSARPWTSHVTRTVLRANLWILGLRLILRGRPDPKAVAEVANHASWLDIFVLNAASRVIFVSKAEVAGWAGIGPLARAVGTVFIRRDRRDAARQAALLGERLGAGQRLLFFPEGTSTDTLRVLPFKPTLFQAVLSQSANDATIQPVTLIWRAPKGEDPRFYGWWGDMDFGSHLLKVLAAPRQGSAEVVHHPPLRVADYPDRKALAAACEAAVRSAFPAELAASVQ